jgi:hypothetical protein
MMTGSSLAIVSIELLTFVLTLKSLKLKCHVIDLEEADLSHIVLSHLVLLDIDISWVDPYETNSAYSTMSCPILTTLIFGDMSNEMVDNFIWIFQQSSQQLKCPALLLFAEILATSDRRDFFSPTRLKLFPTVTHSFLVHFA